ncbi:MAG TPA: hypothetical protein DEG10_18195 [Leclercia adecarboxylata]|nr:hypothetical protein [Leclercia adecarboxylata]
MRKPTAYHVEVTGPSRAPIRVLTLNKSPWFVLGDALAASGANASDLDPFSDFGREVVLLPAAGGNEMTEIVDESAFLWMALRGWNYAAGADEYRFAEWVATDLIPHVRLHGNYILTMTEANHA